MKKVLFVDDESQILQAIRRSMLPLRDVWDVQFEDDPQQALERIASEPFDVVVSDLQMPRLNGVQVLRHVQKHLPDAMRIGLSGHTDSDLALEAASVAHQFFAKPGDVEDLKSAIARMDTIQARLAQPELIQHMATVAKPPSLPDLYQKIMAEAASPAGSLESVGKIVEKDLAMTAKLLNIVNSPLFGLATSCNTAIQAASLIGFDGLRALVLSIGVFTSYGESLDEGFMRDLTGHSFRVSGLCTQIAQGMKLSRALTEQCTLAGALHDFGRLIMGAPSDLSTTAIARMTFNHGDVGAYLLCLWGFTNATVEAVAFHHSPAMAGRPELAPLTVVHIANALDNAGTDVRSLAEALDMRYLQQCGVKPDLAGLLDLKSALETPT